MPALIVPKIKHYDTSFVVMPKDCNYLCDMVFGGKVLAAMDEAAAMAVRRTFYDINLDTALTVGVNNVQFFVGALVGDLIFLHAEVVKVGIKSLVIDVDGYREHKADGKREKICHGEFTFCAVDSQRKSIRHNLTLGN